MRLACSQTHSCTKLHERPGRVAPARAALHAVGCIGLDELERARGGEPRARATSNAPPCASHPPRILLLLLAGSSRAWGDPQTAEGANPLFVVSQEGHEACVMTLLGLDHASRYLARAATITALLARAATITALLILALTWHSGASCWRCDPSRWHLDCTQKDLIAGPDLHRGGVFRRRMPWEGSPDAACRTGEGYDEGEGVGGGCRCEGRELWVRLNLSWPGRNWMLGRHPRGCTRAGRT